MISDLSEEVVLEIVKYVCCKYSFLVAVDRRPILQRPVYIRIRESARMIKEYSDRGYIRMASAPNEDNFWGQLVYSVMPDSQKLRLVAHYMGIAEQEYDIEKCSDLDETIRLMI